VTWVGGLIDTVCRFRASWLADGRHEGRSDSAWYLSHFLTFGTPSILFLFFVASGHCGVAADPGAWLLEVLNTSWWIVDRTCPVYVLGCGDRPQLHAVVA